MIGTVALLLALGVAVAGAAAAPDPAGRAAATCSDGSAGGDRIALADALRHRVDDAPALRLVARLIAADDAARTTILDRVRALGSVPVERDESDAQAGCRTEGAYRLVRALDVVADTWRLDAADPAFEALTRRLAIAFASPERDEVFAPLGYGRAPGAGAPATPCAAAQVPARPRLPRTPTYPSIAASAGTSGTVWLVVDLDAEGLVRAVAPQRTDVANVVGRAALVDAALLAAAETLYEPEYVACRPRPGSYLFRVTFAVTR